MVSSSNQVSDTQAVPTASKEYLAFTIGREEYGMGIHAVQELRSYEAVTQLATAPAYLKGVINLRGTIVPITDLRIRLGDPDPSYDAFTVVVILEMASGKLGVVVDSVSDVIELAPEQIKAPPAFTANVASHVLGLGSVGERILVLVDMEGLATGDDLDALRTVVGDAAATTH